jgi:SHS2 domain-containing protein
MTYKFLPHTADAMFEVKARSLEQVFVDAAKALNAVQVKLGTLAKKIKKEIVIESNSPEMLLYDFLQELVFLKDAEQLLFKDFEIKIEKIEKKEKEKQEEKQKEEKYRLKAICYGDKIDPSKQELLADVKAITLENFRLWKEKQFWKATVIVDI